MLLQIIASQILVENFYIKSAQLGLNLKLFTLKHWEILTELQ